MEKEAVLNKIKNKLIVSCQSAKNEPLYDEGAMNALIDTVVLLGKIDALRLAGKRDIKNTKEKYGENVVVIGITKPDVIPVNYRELVYITPDIKSAEEVIGAGADIIGFDCTTRNKNAKKIVEYVHTKNKLAMGDIATFEDAIYAFGAGCDILSTTLSGYTEETKNFDDTPDFELLRKCVEKFKIPVILEGKIWSENEVKRGFNLGAHSVVIGSAITRPHKIIEKFKRGL